MSHGDSGPYSAATGSSQPLTFIDSDFAGAENTQASEYNYELTFPNEMGTYQQNATQTQTQLTQNHIPHSQLDTQLSQIDTGLSQAQNNGAGDLGITK